MMQSTSFRVLRRLLILSLLCGCLFVLSTPLQQVVLGATCKQCDTNFGNCLVVCFYDHDYCDNYTWGSQAYCDQQYDECAGSCQQSYSQCYDLCTLRDPNTGEDTGSHNSACGHTRSSCELACNNALHQCGQNGGSDCGSTYQDCMVQCCE